MKWFFLFYGDKKRNFVREQDIQFDSKYCLEDNYKHIEDAKLWDNFDKVNVDRIRT